ncbi:uncharacterized [Tachysurus ichikawai]
MRVRACARDVRLQRKCIPPSSLRYEFRSLLRGEAEIRCAFLRLCGGELERDLCACLFLILLIDAIPFCLENNYYRSTPGVEKEEEEEEEDGTSARETGLER